MPARLLGALATAAIIAAVAPAAAFGASGATTLSLNGAAAESLRDAGVGIRPLKPAKGGQRRVAFPIAAGLAGAETTLIRHRGGILLSFPDGEKARLGKLRLVLGKSSLLSAKLRGQDIDFFKVQGGTRAVDPIVGTVELDRLRLKLTRAGARAIARRTSTPVRPGRFGSLSTSAAGLSVSGTAPKAGDQAEQPSGCPLPSSAGPAAEDPLPVATRPAAAVDVAAATLGWHVRESFIRYVATGEGTSVSGGATADPPVLLPGASAPLAYSFHFPFAEGWHDAGANPSDPADDRAALYFGGAVRFLYSGHGIDLTTASPELELAGGSSRAIFTIAENADPARREVLVNLDLSRAASITASGNTLSYEGVPGAIPSGAATSVFGGFYAPGTEFGCFSVSYSTG